MQYILSVDATIEPARAALVKIEGKHIEVIESRNVSFESPEGPLPQAAATQAALGQQSSEEASSETGEDADQAPVPAVSEPEGLFPDRWSNAVLIIRPESYLSMNIELPFNDPKNISRVLDMEVQDLVPFDVSEFLLQHRALAPLADNTFDIHVSLTAKQDISAKLEACRRLGFDPLVVSTPSSVLGGLYHLAPDYFSKNSAFILAQPPLCYVSTCFDGALRNERLIRPGSDWRGDTGQLFMDFKLTLAAMENRYQTQLENVYVVKPESSDWSASELQQALGRNVEFVNLSEIVKTPDSQAAMAGLGAIFAQDSAEIAPLTNFRTREFSYRPPFKELWQAFKNIWPSLVIALCFGVLSIMLAYWSREYEVSRLRAAIHDQINAVIPNSLPADAEPGSELRALQKETALLEEQLKDLSSPTRMSPLDIFSEVSGDFPVASDIALNEVDIRGNHVRIEGSAPDYAAVDRIEKVLKKKKDVYCRIKKDSGSGLSFGGGRSFGFDLWLCE